MSCVYPCFLQLNRHCSKQIRFHENKSVHKAAMKNLRFKNAYYLLCFIKLVDNAEKCTNTFRRLYITLTETGNQIIGRSARNCNTKSK